MRMRQNYNNIIPIAQCLSPYGSWERSSPPEFDMQEQTNERMNRNSILSLTLMIPLS